MGTTEGKSVIALTKLDSSQVVINVEAIKYVEAVPDTLIHFINGDTIIVKESVENLCDQVVRMKALVMQYAQTDDRKGK